MISLNASKVFQSLKPLIIDLAVIQGLSFVQWKRCVVGEDFQQEYQINGKIFEGTATKIGSSSTRFRFIIPIFLHGGILHFVMNMGLQYRIGFKIERDIGWWRMFFIYFLSGIGGFAFSGLFAGVSPSVGASASLYGRTSIHG